MGELKTLYAQVVQEVTAKGYTYTLQYLPACKGVAMIRSDGKVMQGLPLKVMARSLLDTAHYCPDQLQQLEKKAPKKR